MHYARTAPAGAPRNASLRGLVAAAMSKAFVKEGADDDDDDAQAPPPLPAGAKNYMTLAGYRRLRAELSRLVTSERPEVVRTVSWAASNGDRSENGDYIYGKKRLREIDRRIRFLTKRLEVAEVVDPAQRGATDQVFFGATVRLRGRPAASEPGDNHRRRRRSRPAAPPCQLDFADRARAAQGARGRRHPVPDARAASKRSISSRCATNPARMAVRPAPRPTERAR